MLSKEAGYYNASIRIFEWENKLYGFEQMQTLYVLMITNCV